MITMYQIDTLQTKTGLVYGTIGYHTVTALICEGREGENQLREPNQQISTLQNRGQISVPCIILIHCDLWRVKKEFTTS